MLGIGSIARSDRRFRRSLQIMLGLFLFFLAAWGAGKSVGLSVNVSKSIPRGLYVRTASHHAYARFCPDESWAIFRSNANYRQSFAGNCGDKYEDFIKPIVAEPGESVVLSPAGVSVNGNLLPSSAPRERDPQGRVLHHVPFGVYKVQAHTVWVVSSYSQKSYDSRYYGAIPESSIRDYVRPLYTVDTPAIR